MTVVYTCGICEIIMDEKDIQTHECVEAYNQFFIDDNLYFYPVTGTIHTHLLNNVFGSRFEGCNLYRLIIYGI